MSEKKRVFVLVKTYPTISEKYSELVCTAGVPREWDAKKLASLQNQSRQVHLFKTIEEIEEEFRVVRKVPYKFSYRFEDDAGKQSTMMVEDWEVGMLYMNCLRRANNDEAIAVQKVREKYLDSFFKRDVHFFLGTTKQYHNVAPNPFIIVGVFYPPMPSPDTQMNLFELEGGGE
jgi:hypothetical protein